MLVPVSSPTPQPTAEPPQAVLPTPEPLASPVAVWRRINEAYAQAVQLTEVGDTAGAQEALQLVRQLYVPTFQDVALRIDRETHLFVARAMTDARKAVESGNAEVVGLSLRWNEAALYKVAFEQVKVALDRGDVRSAEVWLELLKEGVGLQDDSSKASALIEALKENREELSAIKPQLFRALLHTFALRVRERVDEAVEGLVKGEHTKAAEKTVEAFGFYRLIQPNAREVLGEPLEGVLAREVQRLVDGVKPGAADQLPDSVVKGQALLEIYTFAAADDDLDATVGQLVTMLRLVDRTYQEAVAWGQVIDMTDYEDAELFLKWTTEAYQVHQRPLLDANTLAAADLAIALDRLAEAVRGKVDPKEVSELIGDQVQVLESLVGSLASSNS